MNTAWNVTVNRPEPPPTLNSACFRQGGREGHSAARHRLAEGAAGRHQTSKRRRHQLGCEPRSRGRQAGDHAGAHRHAKRRRQRPHGRHPGCGKSPEGCWEFEVGGRIAGEPLITIFFC